MTEKRSKQKFDIIEKSCGQKIVGTKLESLSAFQKFKVRWSYRSFQFNTGSDQDLSLGKSYCYTKKIKLNTKLLKKKENFSKIFKIF